MHKSAIAVSYNLDAPAALLKSRKSTFNEDWYNDRKGTVQETILIPLYGRKICNEAYQVIKKRKAEMKESIDIIERIIQEGAISDANLRLLVDSIVISEKDKKLHIKINLNAKFERHKDCYDDEGNLTESVFIA